MGGQQSIESQASTNGPCEISLRYGDLRSNVLRNNKQGCRLNLPNDTNGFRFEDVSMELDPKTNQTVIKPKTTRSKMLSTAKSVTNAVFSKAGMVAALAGITGLAIAYA